MNHRYSILRDNGKPVSITWYHNGDPKTATDDHPQFGKIVFAVERGYDADDILRLFSPRARVNDYFSKVGLYGCHFDGSVVHVNGKTVPDDLSQMIVDHVDAGTDPTSLVLFFNKLMNNPSFQSRKELVSFIKRHGLTITSNGNFIAYKGLNSNGKSVHRGTATVNGKVVHGHIPNELGSVITMPRGEVDDNRQVGCSQGLHAGTWNYASGFGHYGNTCTVEIDPADVISVPLDSNEQKLRVCKYTVVKLKVDAPEDTLIWEGSESLTTPKNMSWGVSSGNTTLWSATA